MRLRIAVLLGVVFTLAVMGTAMASPVSAATGMAYGTCYISTVKPLATVNDPVYAPNKVVKGRASISCGQTTLIAYRMYTYDSVWGWTWIAEVVRTIKGGSVIHPLGPAVPYSDYHGYKSKITFSGYTLISQEYKGFEL